MIGRQILIKNNQKVNRVLKEMMMIGKTVQTDYIMSILFNVQFQKVIYVLSQLSAP